MFCIIPDIDSNHFLFNALGIICAIILVSSLYLNIMKSDADLQKDIWDALRWEPQLHAAAIGVAAADGIVTLTGTVDNYTLKQAVINTAKKVGGAKDIADLIKVISPAPPIADAEIEAKVLKTLQQHWLVPDRKIKVTVADGWVTLEGILTWNFQREAALEAVRYIDGVRGVFNKIKIQAEIREEIEKQSVVEALRRNWSIDADKIHVWASGTTITLSGIVSSIHQKDEAERIAWNTPGVWNVINELVVEHD